MPLDPRSYRDIVRRALDEDVGGGDITTDATVAPALTRARRLPDQGRLRAGRARRRVRGVPAARARRATCVASPSTTAIGARAGDEIAEVVGRRARCWSASAPRSTSCSGCPGIATRARRFVDAAGGRITILDTRKTTPTLRVLEKYAVRAGGATNHRVGLFDAMLIKDNHIRLAGGVRAAVAERARAHGPDCRSRSKPRRSTQVDEALAAGADIDPGRQHVDRPTFARRSRAGARPREDRDLRRRDARARFPSSPRPAPTSCRSARSRIPRRPSTSALKSNPL